MKHYTHKLSEISENILEKEVQIAGWLHNRRDHGGVLFLDVRAFGEKVQVVVENSQMIESASKVKLESVIKVKGIVRPRPNGSENLSLKSGKVEVVASEVTVESESVQIPFQVNGDDSVAEDLRLQYRFLDLRTEKMRNQILLRSKVISYIRKRMEEEGFIEFQTPILTASSPEGARDFLVPSRLNPGKFYALPQAPQQFKQLLMVSGFEKYFQIAPCFRDEDARADRSPGEFYQLDLEMSFATQEEVFQTMEPVMYDIFAKFAGRDDFVCTQVNKENSTYAAWVNLDAIKNLGNTEVFKKITANLDAFYQLHLKRSKEKSGTPSEVMSYIFDAKINMRDAIPVNHLTHTNWDAGLIVTCRDEESMKVIKNRLIEIMFNNVNYGKEVSPTPFKRIPYETSMLKYGNDKPDLRNPIEIFDTSAIFASSRFKVFADAVSKGEVVRAIPVPKHGKSTEYFKTEMQNFAKLNGAEFGIAYMIFEDGTVKNCPIRNAYKIDKNKEEIHEEDFKTLVDAIKQEGNLNDGDAIFFACGKKDFATKLAGLVRTKVGNDLNLINKNRFEFCWIVDFPFYEASETEKDENGNPKIEFSHNPFSMPQGGLDVLLLSQIETFKNLIIIQHKGGGTKSILNEDYLQQFTSDIQQEIRNVFNQTRLQDEHRITNAEEALQDIKNFVHEMKEKPTIEKIISAIHLRKKLGSLSYTIQDTIDNWDERTRTIRNKDISRLLEALYVDPLTIKAYQYDIVCNGVELSSGAIRNHRLDIMFKAFEIAGYTEEEVREKFSGMVKAFSYGAPPHGGFAPGIDRMVMLLAGTDSIRDVIAFPLNGKGQDLLMNAPSEVSEKQLRELGIQHRPKKNLD